ncbi:hypothetical protein QFC20_003292 [Naganishia adeliensis]|uniref:Uncharacterized protein n=1 Tax=Naganishia adeliensis TaxID=92952 RepID=A0ACC2WER2_9TREE|nr:hypothetical protein QFC20_003292 [Naganishia adeliensis]
MSQNLFGGLDRPTSLTSDSPFAIANNAMKDNSLSSINNSNGSNNINKQGLSISNRQRPLINRFQHNNKYLTNINRLLHQRNLSSGSRQPPGSSQDQGMNPHGLRSNARDAYMGAGAWNARTGTYGPPQQGQGLPTNTADMRLSRSPSPYNSNPNFVAQQGFAQAVMMAQGGQSSGGAGNKGGGAGAGFAAPAFPTHYQQQFAEQTNPPAGYRQASYPPPIAQQQQQMYTAPSPSQYGQQNYQAQQSPASSGYGLQAASPYNQQQHHRQSQSPYADPNYTTSPAPVTLASPAVIVEHEPTLGRSQSRPVPPAPAGTDVELWQMFSAMDIDQSGQLEANEVQALLAKDHRWANIEPREDCVKMDWYNIFQQFDRDRSGTIDRKELEQALNSFGYPLPSDLVRKLEKRYAPPKGKHDTRPRGVTFDRFLMACVTVKHFTEAFRQRDVKKEGRLTVDYSTFMDLCLSSPA